MTTDPRRAALEALLERLLTAGTRADDALRAEIEKLGGFRAVCRGWSELGGRAASFAELWELASWMTRDAELMADRMSCTPDGIRELAGRIQAKAVSGSAGEAEAELEAFCRESSRLWAEVGAVELAQAWERHAGVFSKRLLV
jgi:hypothetical protein